MGSKMCIRGRGYKGGLARDNTERGGRGYRNQGVTEGGWPATIQRAEAEAIETKGLQRGAGPLQSCERSQLL